MFSKNVSRNFKRYALKKLTYIQGKDFCTLLYLCRQCKKPSRLEEACAIKRILMWQLVFFCFSYTFNLLSRSRVYWSDNVDSYEMYKLRIYISWMSENLILLLTYIYVDTYISGECKKPCRLEEACAIKRILILQLVFFVLNACLLFWMTIAAHNLLSRAIKRILMWQLVFFCFSYTFNLLNRVFTEVVDSYEMYKLRIYISWMSENLILLLTNVDTYISGEYLAG